MFIHKVKEDMQKKMQMAAQDANKVFTMKGKAERKNKNGQDSTY